MILNTFTRLNGMVTALFPTHKKVNSGSIQGAEKDYTNKYPPVVSALKSLKHDVVLDGEMVVFDEHGHPNFNAVQLYNGHNTPIFYYVFDVLWLDGYDLMELPLTKRKRILKDLIKGSKVLQLSESFKDGEGLYELMVEKGFEGIVAKKKNSEYIQGDRSRFWLKMPTRIRQEFIIGGWAESDKARSFRSILFGAYRDGKLQWVGRSGGGYKEKGNASYPERIAKKRNQKIAICKRSSRYKRCNHSLGQT